ncbi:MAG: hypothetical protein SF002_17800 [Alphaproteobacteria bacterium]|nr:hypothetical protein [Alphaproteobacteria bacterium]
MNIHLRNRKPFAALSPVAMRAYLRAHGWTEANRLGDRALVFTREVGEETFEILVPVRETLGDYVARMAEAVHLLALVEQRPETEILADLGSTGCDIVRVRVPETADDGTIGLADGIALYTHTRDLILAAACSAEQPRAVYSNRQSQGVQQYLNKVRLGPTEHGGSVATLLSPVDPAVGPVNQTELRPDRSTDPYERAVTKMLVRALKAASEAVTETITTDRFGAFERRVGEGLSANLCEALAGLVDTVGPVDISVTWAQVRPLHGEEASAPARFGFSATAGPILREAARQFRSREPLIDGLSEDGTDGVYLLQPSGISSKTNIAALNAFEAYISVNNAFIEAALTGDARKDFTVVSSEIHETMLSRLMSASTEQPEYGSTQTQPVSSPITPKKTTKTTT